MKIIIDSRMRKKEKEYLKKYGELVEIECQPSIYDEISAHPDIFFCKINNKIFQAPNLQLKEKLETTQGQTPVEPKYPNDIKYNICQIGQNITHNFKHTDPAVLEYINYTNLKKINVNQGYTKCSISVTSENSCITSDEGIYKTLQKENIDVLLLKDEIIHLLDKNKKHNSSKEVFFMKLTIVFVTVAIVLGFIFLLNHWKGFLRLLLWLVIAYFGFGIAWDVVHGTIGGSTWIVISIICFIVACKILGAIKKL